MCRWLVNLKFHNLFESKRINSLEYILFVFGALGNLCNCAHWGKFLLSAEYNPIEVQKAIVLYERHVLKKCYPSEQFYEDISCFISALKF